MAIPKKLTDLKKDQTFTINGKVFKFIKGTEATNLATNEVVSLDAGRSVLPLDKRAAQILLDRVTH